MKSYKLLFTMIFLTVVSFVFSAEVDESSSYDSEVLTMTTESQFDAKFDSPAKKFYFFKGNKPITEEEFEALVGDNRIKENKKKLTETRIAGYSFSGALAAVAVAFFIPSLSFVIEQANITEKDIEHMGYKTWLDYYNDKYTYVFLPGLITILLTAIFALSSMIGFITTLNIVSKYKYNEMLYKDAMDKYNAKLNEKYKITPDLSMGFNSESEELLTFSLSMRL